MPAISVVPADSFKRYFRVRLAHEIQYYCSRLAMMQKKPVVERRSSGVPL
jgi:hypothetical protein